MYQDPSWEADGLSVTLQIRGASKIALQWYSKCYFVASFTKTLILTGVKTIHRSSSEKSVKDTTYDCQRSMLCPQYNTS
jgi:hypothetical protein